ncbi:hypothetical protein GQ473_06480 [archaeon]|nr:hypothetical protein [archaeon]
MLPILEETKITEKLVVIRPCHTKGKLMGEVNFLDITPDLHIDLKKIENAVIKLESVKNVLYSEDLGLVKYFQSDKNVFIFESGFVRVKNAINRKDIIDTVFIIRNLL